MVNRFKPLKSSTIYYSISQTDIPLILDNNSVEIIIPISPEDQKQIKIVPNGKRQGESLRITKQSV